MSAGYFFCIPSLSVNLSNNIPLSLFTTEHIANFSKHFVEKSPDSSDFPTVSGFRSRLFKFNSLNFSCIVSRSSNTPDPFSSFRPEFLYSTKQRTYPLGIIGDEMADRLAPDYNRFIVISLTLIFLLPSKPTLSIFGIVNGMIYRLRLPPVIVVFVLSFLLAPVGFTFSPFLVKQLYRCDKNHISNFYFLHFSNSNFNITTCLSENFN